jgi:hypothetical protein
MTNEPLLTRGIELLKMLKEDLEHIGAEDLHQLQRAWELKHRVIASECVTQHTLFRKETRWPGYYYRGDHPKLDDKDWHRANAGPRCRAGRHAQRAGPANGRRGEGPGYETRVPAHGPRCSSNSAPH